MIRMMNISDGKRIGKNRTGNPSMSVGAPGYAGDMLMGLLAKGSEPFNSVGMASFTNGYAGIGHSRITDTKWSPAMWWIRSQRHSSCSLRRFYRITVQ